MPSKFSKLCPTLFIGFTLAACGGGGGGGSDDGGGGAVPQPGPGVNADNAMMPAALDSAEAVGQAAVAAAFFSESFFANDDSTGDEDCRTGSVTTQQTGERSVRIVFNDCRDASGDGSEEISVNGIANGFCSQFSAQGDCEGPGSDLSIDFGENRNPIEGSVFADAQADQPLAIFNLLGPIRITDSTTTLNYSADGMILGSPDVLVELFTQDLATGPNTPSAQTTINGTLGAATDPVTGNCLEGSVEVETISPLTSADQDFSNGVEGGELEFTSDGATATAIFNADGSINVIDSTGNAVLLTADQVGMICTEDATIF